MFFPCPPTLTQIKRLKEIWVAEVDGFFNVSRRSLEPVRRAVGD